MGGRVHASLTASDSAAPWTGFPARLLCPWDFQEYWSRLPFPSLVDLPNPGIETMSPALPGGFFITVPTLGLYL